MSLFKFIISLDIHIIQMFVGTTFHSCIDRLSIHSVLNGKTGTLIGVIFSAILIVVCFILFIGPVINYFKGDFIQSSFYLIENEPLQIYSGRDYKLALSFFNKQTNQIVDSRSILNLFQMTILYSSPDGDRFVAQPTQCDPAYFQGSSQTPQNISQFNCFKIPDNILFRFEVMVYYLSVIGFQLTPLCEDPFICTYLSLYYTDIDKLKLDFFKNHYYQMYFSSLEVDQYGQLVQVFHKIQSTQWAGHQTIMPVMYVYLESQTFIIDDSIMPWRNNITHILPAWFGKVTAADYSEEGLITTGVGSFMASLPMKTVIFREYKKLDWLLGMLGGGFFLLYVFFYFPFSYFSAKKNEKKVCESMIVLRERECLQSDALEPPEFNFCWYLTSWLPDKFKLHQKEKKMVRIANSYVDIANLIKKQKITMRNIRRNERKLNKDISHYHLRQELKFAKRELNFQNPTTFSESFNKKLQIPEKTLKFIQENQRICQVYNTNLTVLTLNKSDEAESLIGALEKRYETFSREKMSFQSAYRTCFKKFRLKFSNFIRFFDIFGARPMLSGHPHHYSYISTIITLIIAILAALTFALTIHNMDKVRTRVQQTFKEPGTYQISMQSNRNYKFLLCAGKDPVEKGMVMGQQRFADIKFYQYQRDGQIETTTEFNPIWIGDEPGKYYDLTDQSYEDFNITYCFKSVNNIDYKVYGSQKTEKQAYFGITLKPYCSGTVAYCNQKRNETITDFKDLLNSYNLYYVVPDSKYTPKQGKILSDFKLVDGNIFNNYYQTDITQTIQVTLYQNAIQMIDDTQNWVVGPPPEPSMKTLTTPVDQYDVQYQTISTEQLQLILKIKHSGQVTSIINTNYKIDFLFATIGGCFMIFYLLLGCFGRMINRYFLRARIAKELYSQLVEYSQKKCQCLEGCLQCFRIPCTDNRVIEKIDRDLDCISIAQRADNLYKLSSNFHSSMPAKQLSKVYLKQIIKEDDRILENVNEQPILQQLQINDQQDNSDAVSFASLSRLQKSNMENIGKSMNSIANLNSIKEQLIDEKNVIEEKCQQQPVINQLAETNREKQKGKFLIDNLDLFADDAYMTLDGHRKITSLCGGVCFFILLIFIIFLTQHFLSIYFDANDYVMSYEKAIYTSGLSEDSKTLHLTSGSNFKLLVAFNNREDFRWKDVSNQTKGVGLSIFKVKIQRDQSGKIQQNVEKIDLVQCSSNYLDGFISQSRNQKVFENITLGYCIPDGIQLTLAGSSFDKAREYFKLSIYNLENTAVGKQLVQQLLGNYIPVYYISHPDKDYKDYQKSIHYTMRQVRVSSGYQDYSEIRSNITLINTVIQYDTAVDPNSEFPSIKSYEIQVNQAFNFFSSFNDDESYTMKNEFQFQIQNYVSRYTIKRIKANELLGLIGGAILFVFIGIGILPKSFNEYRMRLLIGAKLYAVQPTSKIKKTRVVRKNGKIVSMNTQTSQYQLFEEFNNFSEWRIFRAWVLSFYGFIREDYQKNKTLKMISLVQSRVSNDLNLINYYKNMFICESYLNKCKQINSLNTENQNINLCRTYVKASVPNDLKYESINQEKIDDDLRYLAKKNNFSDWDINAILIAKNQARINPVRVFEEKWLDSYFQIQRRGSIDDRTELDAQGQSFARMIKQDKQDGQKSSNLQQMHSIQ